MRFSCLGHHSSHIINLAPALVQCAVILANGLVEDDMGSLARTTASDDREVHREVLDPAGTESGYLFL